MPLLVRLLLLVALMTGLAACDGAPPPPAFKGTDIGGASFGQPFTLTGHDGKRHSLDEFKGKVVALFFGYTHCPDVCPTTMLEFAQAAKQLGADGDRLQVLFVSVDPQRDTPAVLAGYIPHFDRRFLGLTGSEAEVAAVAGHFKVVAQRQPVAGGGYTVDHSAGSYLFDRDGKLRVYLPYATPASDIAHDVKALLG